MSKTAGWLGRLGNRLNRMEARLNARRAEVEAETMGARPVPAAVPADAAVPAGVGSARALRCPRPPEPPRRIGNTSTVRARPARERPDPVSVVPWGVRSPPRSAGGSCCSPGCSGS